MPRRIGVMTRRALNAWRKWRAGLTLFGENISPVVDNDLYRAHLSIYHFFAGVVAGRRVLDIGCGAGYGSAYLAEHGAASVLGVDLDPRNIRFATRTFRDPRVTYAVADATALSPATGRFGAIVSSNVFEHLHDPLPALEAVDRMLEPDGVFVLAVPPIVNEESLRANQAIPYHRTNLPVQQWIALLQRWFPHVQMVGHYPPADRRLDFGSPFPSQVPPDAFVFTQLPVEELVLTPSLTAIFVCYRTRT